jgi:hypothetical protein
MPSQTASSKPVAFILAALFALLALALPASSQATPLEVESLSISPAPVLLPPTSVGEQSPNEAFKLKNETEGLVNLTEASIVGGSAGSFTFAGGSCKNVILAPDDECSLEIAFKPEATGPIQATLEVGFMGGAIQNFTVGGLGVEAEIAFIPASEDFGLVRQGEQVNRSLLLRNEGEASVHLGPSSIEGPGAQRFFYEFNGCQGQELKPGQTCMVPVRFEPQQREGYEATLHASADAATATAVLRGRGGGPVVEPTSPPPGFGPVTVGTAGIVRTVTIGNSGDLPAGFFISILAGGDAGSFQLLSENCTGHPLLPATTCSAEVRFRPLSSGPKTATLAFFGEDDGGGMIPLDGVGLDAQASLSSPALGFGPLTVGTRGAPLQVVVRNAGIEPIETGQIAIVGADLDQFALAGDECTGATIAPGAECTLRVRFAPDSAGAKSATLRVGIPGGTLTAALTGTATPAPAKSPAPKTVRKAKKYRKHRHHHHRNR